MYPYKILEFIINLTDNFKDLICFKICYFILSITYTLYFLQMPLLDVGKNIRINFNLTKTSLQNPFHFWDTKTIFVLT